LGVARKIARIALLNHGLIYKIADHQILRYVWRPPSFMRGRKNELAALAAFILTVDRIEGWNKP
jgi:hypothetical protein